MEASDEQKEIIENDNNTIVISNPGTGKTTTLSYKVIELLKNKVKPKDILCITFTDKAKKEMFDAIHDMAKGKFTNAKIMKLNIHTFHSFANNYLSDMGLISGDPVGANILRFSIFNSFEKNQALNYPKDYVISTIMPKTEYAIRYIKSFGITPKKININTVIPLIEANHNPNSSYSIDEMKAFLKYFVDAYDEYEKSKSDEVDFSDMLLLFLEKFQGTKFEYVLVDEMQDMNEIEANIVTMISKNLFLVGDAKQAIFGFQGGSIKNFQKFSQLCDEKFLSTNYRSTQQISDYSKKFFLENTADKKMFEKELANFKSLTTGILPLVISTNAPFSNILKIISENPEKTIGIITRTNAQIIKISKFLDINNLKYSSTSSQATSLHAKNEIQSFIKGLISDRIEDKISASLTIFSPFPFKDAFEFSKAFNDKDHEKLTKIKSWGLGLSKENLDKLFGDVILPLCVSKTPEWYATAISVKDEIEDYLTLKNPTFEGLLDFIKIGEESALEQNTDSQITISTVHKAKGRSFDVVVYLPNNSHPTSFIDTIVDAILKSCGINIGKEIEEESLRIDFVALTRAKEKLIVIGNDSLSEYYHIENLSKIKSDDLKDVLVSTQINSKLSEAYSLFVAGNYNESKKLLEEKDGWLEEFIINYFKNLNHISYSNIKTKARDFLFANIIRIPSISPFAEYGTRVHNALKEILMNRAKIDDFDDDVQKGVKNGLLAIEELKVKFPGLAIESTEKREEIPLSSMTNYQKDDILFSGRIDAVFKHDDGYLIVDYKTDKRNQYVADHKRQLAAYKKMLSLLENIPEEKISTCVVFLALRGNISTGAFDWENSFGGTRDVYRTFDKHLQIVLEWRKDPKKFIKELLAINDDDPLFLAIKGKLSP